MPLVFVDFVQKGDPSVFLNNALICAIVSEWTLFLNNYNTHNILEGH